MSVVLDTVRLRLHDIAHGRSGDKGNRSNISVIPYVDTAYDLLLEDGTVFADLGVGRDQD